MSRASEARSVTWSSRRLFILAAAGSAVGLGNIWRFPYITGENGGGAFVLIYLACILLVGLPVMLAEVLLGRAGRRSPLHTLRHFAAATGSRPAWSLVGWIGIVAGLLLLSYYTVIAGWAVHYLLLFASGRFEGASAADSQATFAELTGNPWLVLAWHTVFTVATVLIIRRGVKGGLEVAIRWFMPLLLVLLVVLLGYAATTSGFAAGVEFVFAPDWSQVTPRTVLVALAHAFFTLSVGMGALMAYGAYVPARTSIVTSVGVIVGLDTLVSIGAALVVFPLVFANGLAPGEGPGLMFVTLPLAFGQLPFGLVFGALFFLLVCLAAITSTISMCEPVLAYLVEEYNAKRARVAISWGVMCWLLGIGSALSFNVWSDVNIIGGRNVFEMADFISQSILLPVGGMLIALFAGWVLPLSVIGSELGLDRPWVRILWRALVGVVAPLGVFAVLLSNLIS